MKSISKTTMTTITTITILLVSLTYFLLTSPSLSLSRSQFFFPISPNPTPCHTQSFSPLKVYMYDLPFKFNIQMLNRHRKNFDQNPVTAKTLPKWPNNSGLKKQHSVEYWLMASLLLDNENGSQNEAIRVLDAEEADVFFLPFFSSLSFNTHGHNMTDPDTKIDKQLQVDMIKFLRESKYWQRSAGRDHVIPMHHPNAFRFLREQVNASILIVADFGRFSKSMSKLSKDVVAPYVHVVDSFTDDNSSDPFDSRSTLLFFKGRTVRKDEGKVRAKLAKVLAMANDTDVHYENSYATGDSIKASSDGMRASKFCLNPAGDTPSSCRLFDAIVSHCVPVIVSDQIELPFEDELDYTQFSVFFSVKEALKPGFMVKQLKDFPKEKWLEMWQRLKNISRHFEYQYPTKKEDAVNMIWRQVKHKVPAAKLAVHRNRRLKVPDWWLRRR